MTANRPGRKRGKKIGFQFTRPKKHVDPTKAEAAERLRLIQEYIRAKGVKLCPPAYSHMDW